MSRAPAETMKTGASPAERLATAIESHLPLSLAILLALGLLLRVALVLVSENRLDADEATVGVMALDILDGRTLPFFFYHQAYNGGAALEAYWGAALFALAGPSAIALKLGVAAIWLGAAICFADVCRRALPARHCWLAVMFFCVGTPFLVEWSVKARGGYAETVLCSVVLLWIACPGTRLAARPSLQGLSFGMVAGIGLWASEMLLLMLPCAGLWLLHERPAAERSRSVGGTVVGFAIGLVPLLIYNMNHEWGHLSQTALAGFVRGAASDPLSLAQLAASAEFILRPGAWLLWIGVAIGAIGVLRTRPFGLAHVLLLYATLYGIAYWLAGTRFLPGVAPSRLLYPLYPALAVLLAQAVAWQGDRDRRLQIAAGAFVVWLVWVSGSYLGWAASGTPREAGSWRGSWSLTDGHGLYQALTSRGIDTAIVSYWTRWPLEFAARVEERGNAKAARLHVSMTAEVSPASRHAAFALLPGSALLRETEAALLARGIPFYRIEVNDHVLLSGLDTATLGSLGLPAVLDRGAWPPAPAELDGFN